MTASIAALVAVSVVAFVIHGVLLSGLYQRAAAAFRPEADARGSSTSAS